MGLFVFAAFALTMLQDVSVRQFRSIPSRIRNVRPTSAERCWMLQDGSNDPREWVNPVEATGAEAREGWSSVCATSCQA